MTDAVPPEGNGTRPLRVREFFLGRQPILDRDQNLFAYELLFRNADVGPANITTDLAATASVIAHASQLGMEKVIGDGLGFVNVDAAVLMSDIFQFLPREKLVLEIVETVRATPEVLERIDVLHRAGFRFALDDVIADTDDVQRLLPFVEFVKLDLRDMPLSALLKLAPQFKRQGKKLLAEKVESVEEYRLCQGLGFDYFQGYYFAKPVILSGKKLSPSQVAVMQLLKMVNSEATSNAEIESAIKRDVSLGLNLLRLVNSAAVGARQRIESLSQALMVLGRVQLQRWLQIMLYAEPCKKGQAMTPLLLLATSRGRLLELMAQRLRPNQPQIADTAFTVGIMSLVDALFGMPMEDIVQQIAVVDEVADALLHRRGFYGELLHVAEYLDHIEQSTPQLIASLQTLDLDSDDLVGLEMAAYEWGDNVCRSAL
jgi:EAL and modified HD-GYP domain-containing signal transduction protein